MKESERNNTKRKILKILFVGMTLCASVSLLGDLAARILCAVGGISFSLNRASSIGIIGGADGPTSVLIMSAAAPMWHTAAEALVLILGILGWRYLTKK